MAASQASKNEIVGRLFAVFRDHGFEGASIADLSRATGLGKSSLYHYFPGGKQQMVEAVLELATALIDSEILSAAQLSGTLKTRTHKIAAILDQMYAEGRVPCVLGRLAASSIGTDAKQGLHRALKHLIEAIETLARESGMSPARARHFAEDWVARLQGALILQAGTGDPGPYKRTIHTLLELSKEDALSIAGKNVS
jgi:AcrR family transcriptional regulator